MDVQLGGKMKMKKENQAAATQGVAKRDPKFMQKLRLGIILGIEFVAIAVILILVFLSGKKSYTVTFDLNGGTLISGNLVQTVPQGKAATAPVVAKQDCYLHGWSVSFKRVTQDMVVEAVWEWDTSTGFRYEDDEHWDYAEISGAYDHLYGSVYVPAYHNEKQILGMADGVFANQTGITDVYMLDGMLYVGKGAFSGCTNLETVELPGTLREIGEGAFEGCSSLTRVVLPEDLIRIPANMFKDCTALEEIVIPASVKEIDTSAFLGCTALKKVTFLTDEITEIDEETDEPVVVEVIGIETIDGAVFTNCTALTEIILPKTLKNVSEYTFNNPELTIYVPFEEGELPEGFAENWHGSAKVEWGYEPPKPDSEDHRKR